jgi:RNA polymerase sigma-70 factor, ECF subfamily
MAGDAGKLETPRSPAVSSPPCRGETEIVERAKTEPQAFGELYELHYSSILNYAYRRTLDVTRAEEITSNTFFKALRALPSYDPRGKFGAWLYRIASNEIALHWRTTRRRREGDCGWREDFARIRFAVDRTLSAEETEEEMRQFARLHDALGRLPERYQTALTLRYFEGLSYEEVADVLNSKLGTVKSLIHRGLEQLRHQFEKNGATLWKDLPYPVEQERKR